MNILITGGAGFIGSAVVRNLHATQNWRITNLDKLTYAGNIESLAAVRASPQYEFVQGDIGDRELVKALLRTSQPDAVMHLAAESHVDRSIEAPAAFIHTNILGTYALLEEVRSYWESLKGEKRDRFRWHQVSTDEVYGSLGDHGLFTEETPFAPNSPYSASKASADHLVRAWHQTYGLPVVTSRCSNNYGPYQFPEKLIPLMILHAIERKPLPIYGQGTHVRDWLHVDDHVAGLVCVLQRGGIGQTYHIGGSNEHSNLAVVHRICDLVDELRPDGQGTRRDLVTSVADRPGHDHRYALDTGKMQRELGWRPQETFETGLRKTVSWYLNETDGWCRRVKDGSYRRARSGLGPTERE